jgi:hypothetical protein
VESPATGVSNKATRGPIDFGLTESQLSPELATWYSSSELPLTGDERFELVNFIDGQNNVTEIRDHLSAESRPGALGVVARYLDGLVRVRVVRWSSER